MIPVIEKYLPELSQLSDVRKKLRECKDEWLEKDVKGNRVLGHNTVRQILESATDGVTYWDFYIQEQWKEEVYKYNKNNGQWSFDGYVFHVRGGIFIAGIGYREQYGSKVATGGKDNQNSAYKAAASDCLKKSASLFGIGEAVYSKIKVQMDDEQDVYNQMQQDPNYALGQQPQQQQWNQQQQMPQQWQQGQQSFQGDPNQYQQNNQQQWNQQSFQQQSQTSWGFPSSGSEINQQQYIQPQVQQQANYQDLMNQQPMVHPSTPETPVSDDDYPFNPHNEGTPEHQAWEQRNMNMQSAGTAQEQAFSAQPQASVQEQGQVQPQNFQAQPMGAPVTTEAPKEPEKSYVPTTWDQNEIQRTHQHKARLGIQDDAQFTHYIRDFLKNESATFNDLKPEQLKAFNDHLEKFSA